MIIIVLRKNSQENLNKNLYKSTFSQENLNKNLYKSTFSQQIMPRPKNFSQKVQNVGSRKSKDKEDFLGKKKTEEEKNEEVKEKTGKEKAEKKEIVTTTEKAEEFPDIELGIDIFSQVGTEAKEEKKEKKEETKKKIKEIKEKAKELEKKIEKKPEDIEKLKEELRGSKEKESWGKKFTTLYPLDDYVKYSAHLGTKAITPKMRQFFYKRRADGLAVMNTNSIDEKLKEAVEFLSHFKPEDVFLACKREAGWKATKKFSEVTGIRVFTKKYPAGIITNSRLPDFFEIELVIVCDPWLDKNALNDAVKMKRSVIALCDTNNLTTGATKIIPCNNKSEKSLGLILYLLAREYLKARGQEKEAKQLNLEDFAGKLEEEKRS